MSLTLTGLALSAMKWVWIGAMVAFGLMEAATVQLVCIWFAVGALAGLIASLLGASLTAQLWTFVLVSAVVLVLTRPMVRKFASGPVVHTNADRVIGAAGRVTETVDAEQGAVYVDGKTWTARSADGGSIPENTPVRVERIEGVKLFVTPAEPV